MKNPHMPVGHMPSVALYRKYRPHTFSEVTGQDHIVKVLEGSIENERISHAYLFAGSRGTGKTSIARIFAKALGTSDNDIYEIDAASNRGIDDIRTIRDAVFVLPLESAYKVYIIDEVHMLTKEAFNALLKTLEEPPQHVIFILATTEIDKLPETVVSRCQTFSFKKPSCELLRELISSVAKKEGFTIESGGADLIALLGDGSFRDALGTLDKVLSSSRTFSEKKSAEKSAEKSTGKSAEKTISLETVERITGAPKNTLVNTFLSGISKGNKEGAEMAFVALSEADKIGIDMGVFLKLVIEKARFALLLKITSSSSEFARTIEEHVSKEDFVLIRSLATEPKNALTSATLAELLSAFGEIGRAAISRLPIELAVIKITSQQQG